MEGMDKKFYDIHCHAMNLSHPNLLAFIKRYNLNLALLSTSIIGPIISLFGKSKINKILNLLSVMENDIADFFLLVEYYLEDKGMVKNNSIQIGNTTYKKIILTPLMMDFGYKNIKSDTFYNIPPKKPIVEQVIDLFNGIKKYTENKLEKDKDGYEYTPAKKEDKIFEIYPFLGINTKNYTLDKIEKMMDKYFSQYKRSQLEFYKNMGKFNGDIETLRSNYFSGIKVYPPLGFDPGPVGTDKKSKYEREKVEYLFDFCCTKGIPVTTHCSDGGFKVDEKNEEYYSSPLKWQKILNKYPDLKLNFGHFGNQKKFLRIFPKKKWRTAIVQLVSEYPNVYFDFSCRAFDEKYYNSLRKLIDKQSEKDMNKLKQRILFGSDFMINLMWIDSYNKYLDYFSKTPFISDEEKEYFCSINSERFLFSGDKISA